MLKHYHVGWVQAKVALISEELLCGLQGKLAGHYIPVSTQHKAKKEFLHLRPVQSNASVLPVQNFDNAIETITGFGTCVNVTEEDESEIHQGTVHLEPHFSLASSCTFRIRSAWI